MAPKHADIKGTPIDSADAFAASAIHALDLLGRDLVAGLYESPSTNAEGSPPLGVFDVVRAFGRVEAWTQALREQQRSDDVTDFVRFAMMCQVVTRSATLPGAENFLQRLRDALAARALDQFEEGLFEGEVAIYWLDQMHAVSVEFGPPSGHPDLLAVLAIGSARIRVAIECKRIQPVGSDERQLGITAEEIDKGLQAITASRGALKCILWLHRPLPSTEAAVLLAEIDKLAATLPAHASSDSWITNGESTGAYQISLARVGHASEFQTAGPQIEDVPAEPVLISRAQVRHTEEGAVESRVTSLLSVRSDQLANRIGNLRDNVNNAIDQLAVYSSGEIGAVAVRIRPPRALGDLWEADRALRASLVRKAANHVALAVLYWDESGSQREPLDVSDPANPASVVYVSYSLKPYFVANPAARLPFDQIDSQRSTFPDPPSAFVRDPATGDVRPIDPVQLAEIEAGADLPPMVAEALLKAGDMPEHEGEATLYLKLHGPLRTQLRNGLIGAVKAGKRQFRAILESSAHLRVVEIENRAVKAVVTIDLRAWLAQEELGLVLSWTPGGFRAALWCPDEVSSLKAASCRVRHILP
jgi:hypothetical protein